MPSKKEQFSAKYTLFADAMNAFLCGDFAKGKGLLRDYINNTIGFVALAKATGHSSKSLMRMLSPAGNPRATNFAKILHHLQEQTGVTLAVKA